MSALPSLAFWMVWIAWGIAVPFVIYKEMTSDGR